MPNRPLKAPKTTKIILQKYRNLQAIAHMGDSLEISVFLEDDGDNDSPKSDKTTGLGTGLCNTQKSHLSLIIYDCG